MDNLFLFCIAAGIAIVFIFCIARITFRWIIRLTVVSLLLLAVIGVAMGFWWSRSSPAPAAKSRPAVTKRGPSDRQ